MRGKRRKPDDPLIKAADEYREAWRALGRAIMDTTEAKWTHRQLTRTVEWLNRILTRSKR